MRTRNLVSLTLLFLFLSIALSAKDESPFVRMPALNNDGSKIAFSFQGDIWTVAANGGKAERITIHEAYDGYPVWNKDGSKIAFSSDRYGNSDIFVIDSEGGIPKRITFHSANDRITQWDNDDELVFSTNRNYREVEWGNEIHKVSANGGTPVRILNADGDYASVSPNGKFIAFSLGWCREVREAYRGPANYNVWIYDIENDKFIQLTEHDGNDIYPKWADNQTIYFLSPRSGRYNVHKLNISESGQLTGNIEQVTSFSDEGARYLSISGDGKSIAFEKGTDIYFMNLPVGSPKKVDISIAADYKFDPIVNKTFRSSPTEYAVSPNGKYLAFVVRGEIFVKEADKKKSKSVNVSNSPYRDQNVEWLNDTTLVFASDRNGQFDLYLCKSSDKDEPNLFKTFKRELIRVTDSDEDETYPIVSHDGKKIAYEIDKGKLIVAELTAEGKLSAEVELLSGWDAPGNVSWSPDDKWLAYSLSDLYENSEIYIQAADGSKKPVNVSMAPRADVYPVWSKDGSKLAFLSNRNNSNYDVWFVWLNNEDWEKTKADWDEDSDSSKDKKKDNGDIKIDFDNIYERLVQVTSLPGDESDLAVSKDGKKFYYVGKNNLGSGNDLFSVKWDGSEIKAITQGGQNPGGLSFDSEYKQLYMIKKRNIARVCASNNKEENLPFVAKMKLNYNQERDQIFEEAWRALNLSFYDPDFHGRDWNELKDIYKPMCMKASTVKDFQDMFNLMLGQINASHMGLLDVNERQETQKEKTGLIGVEVEPMSKGVKVISVVKNSPADKEISKVNVGDIVLAVNGTEITDDMNFFSLMANTIKEKTLLEIENPKGEKREVLIQPESSLRELKVDQWAARNRELVEKYSNGRLGYLHIKTMGWENFEKFEREITARGLGKEGLVIDVRYNNGGWITDYLMAVLNYKQHAYNIPRGASGNLEKESKNFRPYYSVGERLPYAAWMKPSIAMCNQNSYSNAEIFSFAYKTLGIGTLVGQPTFGAVISTGSKRLIDGSYVRLPRRAWYVTKTDEPMENNPAVPDVLVENAPDCKVKGEDAQLKKSVEILLKQIDSKK